MSKRTLKCLYGEINVNVPDSVEDFDKLAGRAGACLEKAILQVVYHKTLGDVREDIVEAAVAAFEFPRLEKDSGKKRAKDGTPILVDEATDDYVKRLFSEKGWDIDAPPTEWLKLLADLPVEFDPSAKERESKPKTLAKVYIEVVNRIYAAGTTAKAAATLGIALTGDEVADRKALGWAIKGREDEKRRAEEAKLKAEFV